MNENKELKNQINIKGGKIINIWLNYNKEISIQKLKEEINNLLLKINQQGKCNIKSKLWKNNDLFEENGQLKLKIKNLIENVKQIIKDKIKSNILNNSQSDELNKIKLKNIGKMNMI